MQDTRIAVVQMTSRVGDVAGNLSSIRRFAEQAAAESVDIVCFPELCVCGYNPGDNSVPEPEPLPGESTARLTAIARDCGLTLLAGLLERDRDGIVYNTQFACGPETFFRHFRRPELYARWEREA